VDQLASELQRLVREGQRPRKLIYIVPVFHNPTGVTMSLERRKTLIQLAVEHQTFIVEDSPYRKVRFEGHSLPSLKALDGDDLVFQVGTFSKLMAPGLRVGWVAASPLLVAGLSQLKSDGGSCPLTQRIIVDFCTSGRLTTHTERVRATYRGNRDRMLAAVRSLLPEVSVEVPQGGYYLWLGFPPETDGDALARCAGEAGVTVLAGSKFFARPEVGPPKHYIRAAFSHATPEEIDQGVQRLASAFRTLAGGVAIEAGR